MDPEALLEHAVFQLTPTRTRCDLVIFNGGISEKIASGLVGPFVSHLKYAKDQLPKGGYSIRLTPPTNVDASWFTKSTFQRFVRFVSTPEVLERFVGLEKEILQIESSAVQSKSIENGINHEVEGNLSTVNGFSKHSPNASKVKNETEGTDGAVVGQEENSKIRLQRLMETRKALLRKEQAMAYARALAAGFELENIDDLLYFADAFGASRLRDACTEFKDLCKKKHGDGLWMDELAAMQAAYAQLEQPYMVTPGIVLTSDGNNGLDQSTDSISSSENNTNGTAAPDQIPATTNTNVQMQMPWPNQIPPYMFNFQKQMQNMSPYQAYPFPGMPPYYNMGWPPNMDEHHRTSSKKKKKKSPNREADDEEEEELTESEQESESDTRRSQSNKKKQQKSSKTVVIKNINYITSDKRNGEEDGSSDDEDDDSVEDEMDEDSLKQVHDIIGSIQKHHQKSNSNKKKRSGQKGSSRQEVENNDGSDKAIKEVKGNDNWENFQNLLMRDDDPPSDMVENHQSVQNDFESGNSRSFDLASEKLNTKRNFGMDSFDVSERNVVNEGRGMEDFANGENFRPIRLSGDDSMLLSQRVSGSGNITREGYIPESSTIKHGKAEDWFVANHSGTYETNGISTGNMFEGNFPSQTAANMEKVEKVVPIDDSFMVTTRTSVDDHFDSQWKTDISMVSGILNSSQTEVPNKLDNRNSLEPDDLCAVFARDSAIGESWSSEMDYGVEISFVEPIQKPAIVETIVPVQVEAPENGNSPIPKKQTRTKTSPVSKIKSDFLSRNKTPVAVRKPITPKSKLEKEEEARKRMEEQMIERQKRIAERTAASGAAKKLPLVGSKVSPSKPGQLKNTTTK
ncbi:COP1-interacting protein 7 [Impatiens glandulifera]|uniref:COP1-interacting protein 7 n=1 Tax=Impatiens glandulifera TaxID=253017 RepID=UPI001FB0C21F|nr:COP1-interacting protein 7 [Impatiens glandulifera]